MRPTATLELYRNELFLFKFPIAVTQKCLISVGGVIITYVDDAWKSFFLLPHFYDSTSYYLKRRE